MNTKPNQTAKVAKPTFDDLLIPLSDAERAYFIELHEYAIAKGMKIKIEKPTASPIYVRYTYKKLYSLVLCTNPTRISIPYGLKDTPNNFERFLEIVEEQADSDSLIEYIQDNIAICDGCAANVASRERDKKKGIKKSCGYYWIDIRGVKRLSCIASSISKYRYGKDTIYNDKDIEMLKRLIDIRIMQIDNLHCT
ncbi:MAG: hypothetical protein FWE06_00855 [Oscillospiraceae bacterium]|nr:hypothetical protein [Oscillospiraceae bacterium]